VSTIVAYISYKSVRNINITTDIQLKAIVWLTTCPLLCFR
jgi:hypothetical protein